MVLVMGQPDYRPWGFYENLYQDNGYKVKRLVVSKGKKISLQYHYKRAEYWTIVNGRGTVILGNDSLPVYPGKTVYVPTQCHHRVIANKGEDITIIEVQLGDECVEEDIVRIEDDYDRI